MPTNDKSHPQDDSHTPLQGFERGARALQTYNLLSDGLLRSKTNTLLVAGEKMAAAWYRRRAAADGELDKEGGNVKFAE